MKLSDFEELEKRHLNIQRFDASFSKNGYRGSTLIFDETKKIVTKQDLRNLEHEMKELKLRKKKEKELRKQKELDHGDHGDDGGDGDDDSDHGDGDGVDGTKKKKEDL